MKPKDAQYIRQLTDDQGRAAMQHLAGVLATYYHALIEERIPPEVALDIVIEYQANLMHRCGS